MLKTMKELVCAALPRSEEACELAERLDALEKQVQLQRAAKPAEPKKDGKPG